MNINRLIVGTIVGGIVLHVTGYLIFITIFGDFYEANGGSATGVSREVIIQWALMVGSLAHAALITYVMEIQPGTLSIGKGIMTGAVVSCLAWLGTDFIYYGATNMSNLTLAVVDPALEIIHGGIAGAVMAPVLAKMSGSTQSSEGQV